MYNVYGLKLQPWRELQAIGLTHGHGDFGGFPHFPEHIISRFVS
jgi:ribonuclease BN (tRNA processing enzyme)